MNANELAKEIDKFLQEAEQLPWGTKQVYLDQSATMLRQQQTEIEALKADNKRLKGFCWETDEAIEFLKAVKEAQEK